MRKTLLALIVILSASAGAAVSYMAATQKISEHKRPSEVPTHSASLAPEGEENKAMLTQEVIAGIAYGRKDYPYGRVTETWLCGKVHQSGGMDSVVIESDTIGNRALIYKSSGNTPIIYGHSHKNKSTITKDNSLSKLYAFKAEDGQFAHFLNRDVEGMNAMAQFTSSSGVNMECYLESVKANYYNMFKVEMEGTK